MIKSTLTAAALALLLAGPAFADDDDHDRRPRGDDRDHRYDHRDDDRDDKKDKNKSRYRRDDHGRDDDDWNRGRHDNDWSRGRDDNDWNRGRQDNDWNRGRAHNDNDRRRDDDWRLFDNWRRDGWRHDRGRDDHFWNRGRDWRYVPPARYRADLGYRTGYESAWRDWERYGRHDRNWRHRPSTRYRLNVGYQSGYEAGWRDAARYFGSGYRPRHWARDSLGSWFFGFSRAG
jgi:hypothetical protein